MIERLIGAFEPRSEGPIDLDAFFFHPFTGFYSFSVSFWTQIHIRPAGKPFFLIPFAFAMTKQDQSFHTAIPL